MCGWMVLVTCVASEDDESGENVLPCVVAMTGTYTCEAKLQCGTEDHSMHMGK